ncbi:MAG: histidine--tRNA ligase [Acidaminococcaceae bacterium]|nr:histidine--tRNA ligase [Acidaminococcaceae bacterium]MBQ9697353.1 histidine--tRNA ligase [Acidaminococcaceae bacterium]
MLTTLPRGTKDILPSEVGAWRYVEGVLRELCRCFGFKEIRTPVFEHTELFKRGIGDTTDVVEKEMYSFQDRSGRWITLRPENTASAVRSFIEHKMYAEPDPAKLFYIGPMFRYDRPQAGRQRQFHQFGVELLGAPGPNADAEIILLAVQILRRLGLQDLQLKINTVGCPECRPAYRQKLQDYYRPHLAELCEDCRSRFDRNPMRLLDCKNEKCHRLAAGAPKLAECLDDECRQHFAAVQELLKASGVDFVVDPTLVRGLDYYTRTAFEIQYTPLGAQSAVLGGGRYDGLVEEVGGPATPGIGFAMGMERVILALESQNLLPREADGVDVFAIAPKAEAATLAFTVTEQLREAGLCAAYDYQQRSMKAQMKTANRLNAKFVLIFGEDELSRNCVTLRDMNAEDKNNNQREIPIADITTILKTEVQKNE